MSQPEIYLSGSSATAKSSRTRSLASTRSSRPRSRIWRAFDAEPRRRTCWKASDKRIQDEITAGLRCEFTLRYKAMQDLLMDGSEKLNHVRSVCDIDRVVVDQRKRTIRIAGKVRIGSLSELATCWRLRTKPSKTCQNWRCA